MRRRDRDTRRTVQPSKWHLKNIPQQHEALLQERDRRDTRPVMIMAQDEGRFGRIDYPRRCWAPKPIRPTVPRQIVREFVYVFAAVGAPDRPDPANGQYRDDELVPHSCSPRILGFLHRHARGPRGLAYCPAVNRAREHSLTAPTCPQSGTQSNRAYLGRTAGEDPAQPVFPFP